MSISSVNNLSSSLLQSILTKALQGTGSTGQSKSGNNLLSIAPQSDNGQLSTFPQLLSALQQLQQSDPAKYQQVTQQIATNLQSASQTAQSGGNTTAANQLSQLATDFTNASSNGQLPNIQDLARAIGGHHHAASADRKHFVKSTPLGVPGQRNPEQLAQSREHYCEHALERRNYKLRQLNCHISCLISHWTYTRNPPKIALIGALSRENSKGTTMLGTIRCGGSLAAFVWMSVSLAFADVTVSNISPRMGTGGEQRDVGPSQFVNITSTGARL